jgi:hypothetical protein
VRWIGAGVDQDHIATARSNRFHLVANNALGHCSMGLYASSDRHGGRIIIEQASVFGIASRIEIFEM